MKLLIVTQAVDQSHPVLGFFHEWLLEFAKHVESLTVICLYEGTHALPENVTVYSLGKESGPRPASVYAMRFIKLAWKERYRYDAVFVHMNPEYLILAGPMWKLLGKRTALWYLHKSVHLRLRLGTLFADAVITASSGSMRLRTGKKRILGHGIDTRIFPCVPPPPYPPLALVTVGRLSPIKRVDCIIESFALLRQQGCDATLTIAGAAPGMQGIPYERELAALAKRLHVADRVLFLGAIAHEALPALLGRSHLFLHASATGSLDKASLEPLSAGVPVITTDVELAAEGIRAVIYAESKPDAYYAAIRQASDARLWESQEVREEAHAYVAEHHELSRLIPRILAIVSP